MAMDSFTTLWEWLRDPAAQHAEIKKWLSHPQAAGRGVRVAVIDTGIDRAILQETCRRKARPIPEVHGGIFQAGSSAPLTYSGRQSAPHGTTVAEILLSIAPEVQLYSADIFGPRGIAEVDALLHAMYHAMGEWKCHILNISLGIVESRLQTAMRKQQLARAVEEGYRRGVLIVAAVHNDHPRTLSYPAQFTPALVSVTCAELKNDLELHCPLRADVEFAAVGRGNVGSTASQLATSWAAPRVSGLAARLLSLKPDLKPFEVKSLLYWWASNCRTANDAACAPQV